MITRWPCTMAETLGCLLSVAASVPAQSEVRPTGAFSILHFHAEGGDLLGAEVKILLTRNGYQAALQIAEGALAKSWSLMSLSRTKRSASASPTAIKLTAAGASRGPLTQEASRGGSPLLESQEAWSAYREDRAIGIRLDDPDDISSGLWYLPPPRHRGPA
jgi:hypothetical protein